ncbi:MAG: hypothetical protein ACTJLK_03460 [Anaplasma sp.]
MGLSHTLEVYLLLFADSVMGSMALPVSGATVFRIMCYFGGYGCVPSIAIATFGSSVGGAVNWLLGRLVVLARAKYHRLESGVPHIYVRSAVLALLALFAWMHVAGSLIGVLCGCLRVRASYTYLTALVSHLAYFVYQAAINNFLSQPW